VCVHWLKWVVCDIHDLCIAQVHWATTKHLDPCTRTIRGCCCVQQLVTTISSCPSHSSHNPRTHQPPCQQHAPAIHQQLHPAPAHARSAWPAACCWRPCPPPVQPLLPPAPPGVQHPPQTAAACAGGQPSPWAGSGAGPGGVGEHGKRCAAVAAMKRSWVRLVLYHW
jgi:hypothetical protein